MLTLRSAAQLLARADSLRALRPIAAALGFTEPEPLDESLRRALGLSSMVSRAEFASGPETMRLLLVELAPTEPDDTGGVTSHSARERTKRVAAAVCRTAPDRHWCLITLERTNTGHFVCLATATPSRGGVRLAALGVHTDRVLDSDAETLRTLAAVTERAPLLRHARFSDILRRDALGLRFYRALDAAINALAASLSCTGAGTVGPVDDERRELALLCASRCLFLAFLEAKGWLDQRRDFLLHHLVRQLEQGGRLHDRLLRPLFFGTLNTPDASVRRRRGSSARSHFSMVGSSPPPHSSDVGTAGAFPDDAITHLVVSVIDRYRFTAHEDSEQWSEAAVDPEMLGRAFEGLMADTDRRRSGSFYTPPGLVAHTVRNALSTLFEDTPLALPLFGDPGDGATSPYHDPTRAAASLTEEERASLRERLERLRIIDPACGSGAFLVHMLETLDALLASLGDERDAHSRRRDLLARTIFGVDRQPIAVWLCELRLWLSVVIECPATEPERIPPLPNLDHHIRVGDSLAGGGFRFASPGARALSRLRERYARASGPRKLRIAETLDREERLRAVGELARRREALQQERRTLLTVMRGRDLFGERRRPQRAERLRLDTLREQARALSSESNRLRLGAALPFRFAAMFADVAALGGFSLVIGRTSRPQKGKGHR